MYSFPYLEPVCCSMSSFFFLTLFYFAILYWFCHTSTWIRHGCTRVPHPEPSSHLPPRTIPLGHPNAPAPSVLYPASNLDWRLVSYMILWHFSIKVFIKREWRTLYLWIEQKVWGIPSACVLGKMASTFFKKKGTGSGIYFEETKWRTLFWENRRIPLAQPYSS